MLEFLSDKIFVLLGGRVLQQTVASCMGIICASTLADLDLYSSCMGFSSKTKRC